MNFENQSLPPAEQKEIAIENLIKAFEKIESGEFITSEGLKKPLRKKVYANAVLRGLLFPAGQESGKISILGVDFEVSNGRRNKDSKMVSIIHRADRGIITNYLLKKFNLTKKDINIEIPPIAELETGKFMTQSGEKSPLAKTIYATETLRKMLGVAGDGGEIMIEGEAYQVKMAKKLPGQENYSNFVQPNDRDKVLAYLDQKLSQKI